MRICACWQKLKPNLILKMKLRKIIFILSLILANNYSTAQSINDTIIRNVMLIQEKDIVKNIDDYLIDVIIDFDTQKPSIVFNNSKLPTQFFSNQLFKNKPYILIKPDDEYYNALSNGTDTELNDCDLPLNINIYHQRTYFKNKPKIDSIKRFDNHQPKLIFNSSIDKLKTKDNIVLYYTFGFGSTCCPRDPNWDIKEKLDEFISGFENFNNVKIGDVYKKITGKEGEHKLYFTLSNLNKKQKLKFLQKIRYWTYIDRHIEDIKFEPQIFTPSFVKKEGLKLITEK